MRFFYNSFISQAIELKFGTEIQNWMLILIFGSKSGFRDDFGQYEPKPIILRPLLGRMPLRYSIVMAKPKVPVDQKLFERMCFMLKLNVTKFQLPTPNDFRTVFKKPAGKANLPPPPRPK